MGDLGYPRVCVRAGQDMEGYPEVSLKAVLLHSSGRVREDRNIYTEGY